MRNICTYILFLFFLFSCQDNRKREGIIQLVREWQGKEIVFPENMMFSRYLSDTADYRIPESKQAVFTLKNTGSNPLVIINTAVTCGCAAVSFDKHPAAPGETLKVVVDMTPKDSGFFSETITVKTNTKEYIKLTIRGQGS
jgi:hypothetical protein